MSQGFFVASSALNLTQVCVMGLILPVWASAGQLSGIMHGDRSSPRVHIFVFSQCLNLQMGYYMRAIRDFYVPFSLPPVPHFIPPTLAFIQPLSHSHGPSSRDQLSTTLAPILSSPSRPQQIKAAAYDDRDETHSHASSRTLDANLRVPSPRCDNDHEPNTQIFLGPRVADVLGGIVSWELPRECVQQSPTSCEVSFFPLF